MGIRVGDKLLVLTRNKDIVLRKTKELSIKDIAKQIDKTVKEEHIDVDKLVDEAIEWARKQQ